MDAETDTFELNSTESKSVSLSAQLISIEEVFNTGAQNTKSTEVSIMTERPVLLELPPFHRLWRLLEVYFTECNSFLPLLDQEATTLRITGALRTIGYSENLTCVQVSPSKYSIMALLSLILVLGECYDNNDGEPGRPGWKMYQQTSELIKKIPLSTSLVLDTIQYHALGAIYMVHVELLRFAAHHIAIASHMCFAAKLNNQRTWQERSPDDRMSKQRLWWCIYYLDRHVSQRRGTPYLIRDLEVAVGDPAPSFALSLDSSLPSTFDGSIKNFPRSSSIDQSLKEYMQVLVNVARIWGHIWDKLFAASAMNTANWLEVEILDTRIVCLQRQLPAQLTWDTSLVHEYFLAGESEAIVRRRLLTYLVSLAPSLFV